MNRWVIVRSDGKFVADMRKGPPSGSSYTTNLKYAKTYTSREAAEADCCPGNETVINVEEYLR